MVQSLLEKTLSIIKLDRENDFDKSFQLVDQLLQNYGEDNLAERLYRDIPKIYAWEIVADLFGILIWSMSDAGAAILSETTNQWLLEGNNIRKIKIALHLDLYPFRTQKQMHSVLSKLAHQYPEISKHCYELIASRKS